MRWMLFLLLFLGSTGGAVAAAGPSCRLCGEGEGSGLREAAPAVPVRLEVETSLDFGKVLLTGPVGGTARIAPDGTASTSGALSTVSGRTMLGEIVIRGEAGRSVRVGIPRRVDLHGLSGGVLSITDIEHDLPPYPRLDRDGRLRVRFGGALLVTGEADGDYRGEVPITVDYL